MKEMKKWILALAASVFVCSAPALAADYEDLEVDAGIDAAAAPAPAPEPGPAPAPVFDPADPIKGISPFLDAVMHRNWWMVLAFATTVVVWLLRKWVVGKGWFGKKAAGYLLNIGLTLLVFLIPFFASGKVSWGGFLDILPHVLKEAAAAALFWHGTNDVAGAVQAARSKA